MFMQNEDENDCEFQKPNVCWYDTFMNGGDTDECCKPRYFKSPFHSKVKWDIWTAKNGCCRTMGPPPNICLSCPEHFLKKHSRQVPVFFPPEELKPKKTIANEEPDKQPVIPRHRVASLDTGLSSFRTGKVPKGDFCGYPKPPSRMGLFRGPGEPSYEQVYKMNRPRGDCPCDKLILEDLVESTRCAGAMAAELERGKRAPKNPPKDHIRANAIRAIRMPARKLKRCYIDKCGVHLLDMSESPYVLRPGFGKVPGYIYRRKLEQIQEDIEFKQQMQQQTQNDDMGEMVDAEREIVIQGLKEYWHDLLREHDALSCNEVDNERHREAKADLECRMKEVEADLRLITSTNCLWGDVQAAHYQ